MRARSPLDIPIIAPVAVGSVAAGIAVPPATAMAVTLISVAFLGGVLGLGLTAILRARQEDIPAVVRALGRWLRR